MRSFLLLGLIVILLVIISSTTLLLVNAAQNNKNNNIHKDALLAKRLQRSQEITIDRVDCEHKKKKEDSIADPSSFDLIDVNANAERDAEVFMLHKALALLPDDQRESIILFEISGFSIKEIVEVQGVSESAVKQRLKRGRAKLIEILTFESDYKSKEVKNGTK